MAFPSHAFGNASYDHSVIDAKCDLARDRGGRPLRQTWQWFPQEFSSKLVAVHINLYKQIL